MFFQQFYLPSLGHASYLVASEETGEALVLDPRRDTEAYFAAARHQGLALRYAMDTHQHNDYLSGICELPQRSDVQLLAGARAALGYSAHPLEDGARWEMGEVAFEVMHTPGHTPEHVSLLVRDRDRGEAPVMLLSGGALLVGDVARPDLLGERAETEQYTRELCQTLQQKILPLPDYVEVYPTHVAGSLCGGNIGSRLATTIGYERRLNPMLTCVADQEDFVGRCLDLDQLPAVPPYWPRMRQGNQQGPAPLGVLQEPPALDPRAFQRRREESDALVVDCRSPEAFASHIPGALNIGLGNAFPTWAGTVLPPERPLLLVLDDPAQLWEVCWHLLRIGYELPIGWLAGGMFAWRVAGMPLAQQRQWTVWELETERNRNPELVVLDVRQPVEWYAGRVPGARHITGAVLPRRLAEVPQDAPVAVICGSGYRSSVAASLLRHHGYQAVINVLGGTNAWKQAGLPMAGD